MIKIENYPSWWLTIYHVKFDEDPSTHYGDIVPTSFFHIWLHYGLDIWNHYIKKPNQFIYPSWWLTMSCFMKIHQPIMEILRPLRKNIDTQTHACKNIKPSSNTCRQRLEKLSTWRCLFICTRRIQHKYLNNRNFFAYYRTLFMDKNARAQLYC